MKTVCVLLTIQPIVDSDRPLAGRLVADWLSAALDQALPGVPRRAAGPFATPSEFLAAMTPLAKDFDEVVLVGADGPFLRPDLVTAMLSLHREYRADYTFADGYPAGLTAEIFRPSILPVLTDWAAGRTGPFERDTLFQLLSVDINRFDVETQLSPIDLRTRRLSLTADSRRNRVLLDRYAEDAALDTRGFLERIEASVERSRTLPATLHVQIVDGVLQIPVWSPLAQFSSDALQRRSFLSRERWNDLLDRALAFAGDLTVLPSFWGEPSLHPEVVGLFSDALAKPGLRLCVETSGLGWGGADLEALAATRPSGLEWIVELDSDDPETYDRLRGKGFAEAQAFTGRLVDLFPGHVWPQTVRMADNEAEMESFYKHWKERAGRVIIQKHNDFGGRLPRSKPSDLSPWKRHPCWHLARDLAVFLDGTAVVCRDDFSRTQPLGNAWTDAFALLWERGTELWSRHAREDWPGVCRNCDEWYTFHF
jgi:spiro-SPASM protein